LLKEQNKRLSPLSQALVCNYKENPLIIHKQKLEMFSRLE